MDATFHEVVFSTPTVRHLRADPVARADLEYVVEAATMAPSAGNGQPWHFVVVVDEALRRELGQAYREVGLQYIRDGVLARTDISADRRRVYEAAMYTVEHLGEAPALIVVCMRGRAPDDADVASGYFGSIYPAIQNLMLAARARGLGTVLATLATSYSPVKPMHGSIEQTLGLPSDIQAVALIPVGYPKYTWRRPRRDPATDRVFWNRWGQLTP